MGNRKNRKRRNPRPVAVKPTTPPDNFATASKGESLGGVSQVGHLVTLLNEQKAAIDKLSAGKGKDGWDKLSVLATLASSVLISGIGLFFTIVYQQGEIENREFLRQRQAQEEANRIRVNELELVAKLLPALGGQDVQAKRQAYLTINALGNTGLMTKLALDDASLGAQAALTVVSNSPQSSETEREAASRALGQIRETDVLREASKAIVHLRAFPREGRVKYSTGFLWHSSNLIVASLDGVTDTEDIRAFIHGPFVGESLYTCKIKTVLRDAGLVLLTVDGAVMTEPLDAAEQPPTIGERVVQIERSPNSSQPMSSWLSVRTSSGTRLRDLVPVGEIKHLPNPDLHVLALQGNLIAGGPGSPVLNGEGKVVGIALGHLSGKDTSFAVPAAQLSNLLDSTEDTSLPIKGSSKLN
jgi:hypothetical protein